MHDLPSQTLLQQAHARNISGEELEVFGKKAAAQYSCGECSSLTEAVVETVKHAGLSPEQVRRVIEFTNQNAYSQDFKKKEGSSDKYIEFEGGPASPSDFLMDLNDGGGGTVFDRGIADYSSPPVKTASIYSRNRVALGLEKTAAVEGYGFSPAEAAFEQMWQAEDASIPYADPYQDSIAMREKLATMRDNFHSDLGMLETEYMTIGEHLYDLVKQAAMEGTPLGHVIQAWQDVTPGDGFVKAAFAIIGPRLVEQEVFPSRDGVAASLTKTAASSAMPNLDHPLLKTFSAFCGQLTKMAEVRAARDEADDYFNRVDWFIKKAGSGGALGKIWGAAGKAGEAISGPVGRAARLVGGEGAGEVASAAARYAPKAALAVGGYVAADTAKDHLKYSPVGRVAKGVASHVPWTDADRYREMMVQQRYMR